jgi:hypothetical protein
MAISRRGVLISTVGLLRYACRRGCLAIPSLQLLSKAVSVVAARVCKLQTSTDVQAATPSMQSVR